MGIDIDVLCGVGGLGGAKTIKQNDMEIQINVGEYFWAKSHDCLIVLKVQSEGRYSACGFNDTFYEDEFEFIEKINQPYGTEHLPFY